MGIKLPHHVARALVTVFFGVAGSWSPGGRCPTRRTSYEAFLLIIAYWIGPWLGVMFADQYLRRGRTSTGFLYDRSYANWAGLLSFADRARGVGGVVLQPGEVRRLVAKAVPEIGDITFFVGFLLAGAAYLVLCRSKIAAERAPFDGRR